MFDIKLIRHDPDAFDAAIGRLGVDPVAKKILDIDREKRLMQTALQEAQSRRNEVSQKVGAAKAAGENANDLIAEMTSLKSAIKAQEAEERTISAELDEMMAALPNLPQADVPDGESEDDNKVVRTEGQKPVFDFTPVEHFDLGAALGLMDFDAAAKMSGSRFVILKGPLARLERALGQFMLDLHTTDHGYQEASVPSLVKDAALFGTGNLPKFAEDLFRTEQGHWMIPTAEVPLTNICRDSILAEDSLPIRTTALTPCYRSEAGAAGKDTRGMIRQHQFSKVEMVSIVAPEDGAEELERMTGCAEAVLKALGLAYQVIELCTGDLGFAARKTYDLEVWLPGQDGGEGRYREISSCSLCGDFQARRMNMRYQPSGKKGTKFPYTLNGSGLAVGRTLIAVMENYQLDDGSIVIPDILKPYMGGVEVIGPGK